MRQGCIRWGTGAREEERGVVPDVAKLTAGRDDYYLSRLADNRELRGMPRELVRAFSKRTEQVNAEVERRGGKARLAARRLPHARGSTDGDRDREPRSGSLQGGGHGRPAARGA
jgi:hypothetical protein